MNAGSRASAESRPIGRIVGSFRMILWASLLVSIPVTSHPWISRLTGGSLVSPLSLAPLLLLTVVWLGPYLLRGGSLPSATRPLLAFVAIAVISGALSLYEPILPYRGDTPLGQNLQALTTLAVGLGFYLHAAVLPRSEADLRASLRWIHIGGAVMLLWSSVQVTYLPHSNDPVPLRWQEIHHLFSIRDLFRNRVTGFAYEPSWLADQLAVLYLPLWMASVLKGVSAFEVRFRRLTPELLLLAWGAVILYFTLSRIGLAAFLAMLLAVALYGIWTRALAFWRRRAISPHQAGAAAGRLAVWRAALSSVVAILLLALLALGLLGLGARIDERLANLFDTDFLALLREGRHPAVFVLADRLHFGERITYWIAGLRAFSLSPLLGVGPGNAGFFFTGTVPYFGYYLPEIIRGVEAGGAGILNTKSLWIRILAETGILGFMAFAFWLVALFALAWTQLVRRPGLIGLMGLAGVLACLAQLFEGFSLDTFALPQLWIMLGLVSALIEWADKHPAPDVRSG